VSKNSELTTDALYGCIYCRRSLPSRKFTREHVLSRAFGTFADAPTLQNLVCGDCNQFFGDHLETRVARGAFEGLLRYQRGAKAPNREGLMLRYVEFTIPEGSAWAGVRLNLAWRNGKLVVDLISQVALFDCATSEWVHFSDADIEADAISKTTTLDTKTARIYGRSAEDRDRLLALLARRGISFGSLNDIRPPEGLFQGGDIEVEVTFTINKGIRRCMAKYAFNFLAFVSGATFALEHDFDAIRRFVRYGETAGYELVRERFGPILQDDSETRRQTSGHLLTVNWAASGVHLVGQVSLFNSVTYAVSLTRHYRGLWRPVSSGLHFNLLERKVQPLQAVSGFLLP
jgi:hypothetical protein